MRHSIGRFAAYSLIGFAACVEWGPEVGDCAGTLAVSVAGGVPESWTPMPSFSWSPGCPVETVAVSDDATGEVHWFATTAGRSNAIAPPVRYASTPEGAVALGIRVSPLTPGRTYRVVLSRLDTDGDGERAHSVGALKFVP